MAEGQAPLEAARGKGERADSGIEIAVAGVRDARKKGVWLRAAVIALAVTNGLLNLYVASKLAGC